LFSRRIFEFLLPDLDGRLKDDRKSRLPLMSFTSYYSYY